MRFNANCRVDGNKVISYVTHVATIHHDLSVVHKLGYWSKTTSKHINMVARHFGYEVVEELPEPEVKEDSPFAATAMVMMMGEVLTDGSVKEKVAWKLRMLKASMGEALMIPSDWNELSDEVKLERLNKIEEVLA